MARAWSVCWSWPTLPPTRTPFLATCPPWLLAASVWARRHSLPGLSSIHELVHSFHPFLLMLSLLSLLLQLILLLSSLPISATTFVYQIYFFVVFVTLLGHAAPRVVSIHIITCPPPPVTTATATTARMSTHGRDIRGFTEEDFERVADFFDRAVEVTADIKKGLPGNKLKDFKAALEAGPDNYPDLVKLRDDVTEFARAFPTIGFE